MCDKNVCQDIRGEMFSSVILTSSKVGLESHSTPTVDCEMVHVITGSRRPHPESEVGSPLASLLLPPLAEPQHRQRDPCSAAHLTKGCLPSHFIYSWTDQLLCARYGSLKARKVILYDSGSCAHQEVLGEEENMGRTHYNTVYGNSYRRMEKRRRPSRRQRKSFCYSKDIVKLGMVVHTCNPGPWEAEAGWPQG